MRNKKRQESGTWATILREERERRDLTQDELAELAGVSRWTIMRWENGAAEGKPGHLRAVATALTIDPARAFRAIGWLDATEDDEPADEPPIELLDDTEREIWSMRSLEPERKVELVFDYRRRMDEARAKRRMRRQTG